MQVKFLGFADYDFNSKEGSHIDGIKIYWCFLSDSRNYTGYEVGSYFIPRSRRDLIEMVNQLKPFDECDMDMGYNGKRVTFNSIFKIDK